MQLPVWGLSFGNVNPFFEGALQSVDILKYTFSLICRYEIGSLCLREVIQMNVYLLMSITDPTATLQI